jgi:hypothetical protein
MVFSLRTLGVTGEDSTKGVFMAGIWGNVDSGFKFRFKFRLWIDNLRADSVVGELLEVPVSGRGDPVGLSFMGMITLQENK